MLTTIKSINDPVIMKHFNTSCFKDTLLDIPQDLINLISQESFRIARHISTLNYCAKTHQYYRLACHRICHICKIDMTSIACNWEFSHGICESCFLDKKYLHCDECAKMKWNKNECLVKYSYAPENELHRKINFTITPGDQCRFCFNNAYESCVKCKRDITNGINLIKCEHYCVPEGKKVVYFCDDDKCSLVRYSDVMVEKLTIFDNPMDRLMIERRTF